MLAFSFRAFVRGGRGLISQLTFACIPEPDHVKKVPFVVKEEKDAPGKDDIEVKFENVEVSGGARSLQELYRQVRHHRKTVFVLAAFCGRQRHEYGLRGKCQRANVAD